MRRRVIKQGLSTLTISLPSKWIQRYGVAPGDEVEVSELEGDLILSKGVHKHIKRAEVDLKGVPDRLMYRYLNNLYVLGYDELNVLHDGPSSITTIQTALNPLLGFTIVDQKTKTCVIKDIVETKTEDFDKVLKQLIYLLELQAEDTWDFMDKNNQEGLTGIKPRDKNINRFAFYCLRLLNKKGYSTPKHITPLHNIIMYLESIGDEYANMAEELTKIKKPVTISTKKNTKEVLELFKSLLKLHYNFDKNLLIDTHTRSRKIRFEFAKVARSKPEQDFIVIYHSRKVAELLLDALDSMIVLNLPEHIHAE